MMGMFWFGVGIAAGVAATRRASDVARRLTPAGVAENLNEAARELGEAIGSFGADVRAGMAEREAELHATVAARSGIHTAPSPGVAARPGWTRPAGEAPGRRAGRGLAGS